MLAAPASPRSHLAQPEAFPREQIAAGAGAWCNPPMLDLTLPFLPRPALLAVLGLGIALSAQAQQAPEPVRQAVERLLLAETSGLPGRVSLSQGAIDPRNQLPPCSQLEAFLPAGARAWGQISVGVRCLAPSPWNIFVPARVSVFGEYLVIARPLPAGRTIGLADLRPEQGDLTTLPESVMQEAARAVGQTTRYALAAGQPLKSEMLRMPPAVQQGQKVRVVSQGAGFQVSNEGVALNTVADGQVAQVRLVGGQVLSGIARPGGVVEIRP